MKIQLDINKMSLQEQLKTAIMYLYCFEVRFASKDINANSYNVAIRVDKILVSFAKHFSQTNVSCIQLIAIVL